MYRHIAGRLAKRYRGGLLLVVLNSHNTFATMSEGKPTQYTPEEIAQLEKSREISDSELLKGGAEYVVGDNGEKAVLLVTEEQKESIHSNLNHCIEKMEAAAAKLSGSRDFDSGEGRIYAGGLRRAAEELKRFEVPKDCEFSFSGSTLVMHTPVMDITVFSIYLDTFRRSSGRLPSIR